MASPAAGKRLVALFGGAAIQVDGAPVRGRATHRHPLAIAAYLVLNAGRGASRDKLIALLWPERDADAARNLLKVNVHELRKELGDTAIKSFGDQLSVDLAEVACDVGDFLAAIDSGDDQRAVDLYSGPFLDGFFLKEAGEFEQWAERERARLAAMYGAALERLAATAESQGDFMTAVKWRRAQSENDPFHPDVAERFVRALAASGDRAGAIQFAESFTERRRREFELSDDHELVSFARQHKPTHTPVRVSPVPPLELSSRATDAVSLSSRATDVLPLSSRATERSEGVEGPGLAASSRLARTIVVPLILGAVFLGYRSLTRRAESPPATDKPDALVIAPFHVIGADMSLREGFVDLLAERFNGEAGPRALDPRRVAQSWKFANATPTLDDMLATARSLGAAELLAGEIARASDSTAITVRLYSTRNGVQLGAARADVASASSLASVADRLTIELLARAIGEPEDRIGGLLRRPLGAARTYLAAQRAYRSARYVVAESLYAQALASDSTFGAAGLGLAMANSWTVINEHYGIGRDAAIRNAASMSERDRLFTRAFFGPDPALGSPQPAPVYLSRWEDLVEKYPDWTEAWYQLGDRYYHFGGLSGLADADDRARYAFRRALAQDSAFAAPLHHLVEIYAARGERTELRAAGQRYFAANPTVSRDRSAIGWEIAMGLGDSTWVRRVRAAFDSMPREELTRIAWVTDLNNWPRGDAELAVRLVDRKSGTATEHEKAATSLFSLSVNAGNKAEARVAAAALGAQFPDRPIGALWDLYGALFAWNDTALAADAAGRLRAFAEAPASGDHVRRDQHHLAACMEGYYRATRGELAAARAAYDRVAADVRAEPNNFAKRNGEVCLAMLNATTETGTRSPRAKAAVAQLDTILLRERVPPHVILEAGTIVAAQLHAALGDTAAALVAARRRERLTGDPLFLAAERRLEALLVRAETDSRRQRSP